MSIARLEGGITESHGEIRRQHLHLHLQLRSGRLQYGKQVAARGNLFHLRNGGDFGFLERIPEIRRGGVDSTHTRTACSQARNAHHALGSRVTAQARFAFHLCAPEKSFVICSAHVSPFVPLSLAFHHEHIFFLIHSSFFHDTRTRTTIGTTRSIPRTPSAPSSSPRTPGRKAPPSRTTLA